MGGDSAIMPQDLVWRQELYLYAVCMGYELLNPNRASFEPTEGAMCYTSPIVLGKERYK